MENLIETLSLTKKFGDFTAVDGLSINVKRGEVFGFLGPNGAGKTTSISMMVGLLKPTSGKVLIEGQEVKAHSDIVKTKVGVCPQNIVLWPLLTARENLVFAADMYNVPRKTSSDRADGLLADLQLSDKANTKAKALSGGMKRRLNLAMALIHDPEILLLDEPSPGLDPQTRLVLWDYINDISKKGEHLTIILTTHSMEEADRLSDRIAIIDHGMLRALDTPENLRNSLGEGDIVEMRFKSSEGLAPVAERIGTVAGIQKAVVQGPRIVINAYNSVQHMPAIFGAIPEKTADGLTDLKLRKNTLEDVFLSLTGKALREDGGAEETNALGHLAGHLMGTKKDPGPRPKETEVPGKNKARARAPGETEKTDGGKKKKPEGAP